MNGYNDYAHDPRIQQLLDDSKLSNEEKNLILDVIQQDQNLNSDLQQSSSENLTLQLSLQTAQKKILEQAEKIENMNGSDLQLKKSEDLKKEAEEMTRSAKAYVKNARNEAEKAKKDAAREIEKANRRADAAEKDRDIKIAEVESRCKRDNDAASQARQQAEKLQKSYQELIDNEKSEIDKAATKKIEQNFNNMRKREKDYKESVEKHYSGLHVLKESWYVGIMTFCILWLVVLFCTNTYMISCVTRYNSRIASK